MLATYMRRMRNNNLEIRIAGSSCRPQLENFFYDLKNMFSSDILQCLFLSPIIY